MFTLEKKLYAWELEQAEILKKTLRLFVSLSVFIVYLSVKIAAALVFALIARPQLRRQIAPNQYENVEYLHYRARA